jgi:MFS family permease
MNASAQTQLRLVLLLCSAEALAMAGFGSYPALLPTLQQEWAMNGSEAGLVSGAFFLGYMLTVPFLSGWTDRMDARLVFAFSSLLAAAATASFGLFASGLYSGMVFQAIAGAGLAGTYMPGLKALTDRVHGPQQSRYISFYTATFGIGASGSLLLAGWLADALSWQTAFVMLGVFPVLACVLVLKGLQPSPVTNPVVRQGWGWARVWAQPVMRQYIIGYAVHCWELFGMRSWQVAFFSFAFASSASQAWINPTEAAALLNLLGLPASILGNEVAMRWGRPRWIALTMLGSGLLAWLAGASVMWPWFITLGLACLYNIVIMADSASLTAGLVAHSDSQQRGTAMALYSMAGFGAGFVAPVVFGAVLDLSGGQQQATSWILATGSLSLGCLFWGMRLVRTLQSDARRRSSMDRTSAS